jgi:hypothetical protein
MEELKNFLADKASKLDQPNNWRVSIVDLMKLVGLDSELSRRIQLANRLGFKGDVGKKYTRMNDCLRKQLMQILAKNGGSVPVELNEYKVSEEK